MRPSPVEFLLFSSNQWPVPERFVVGSLTSVIPPELVKELLRRPPHPFRRQCLSAAELNSLRVLVRSGKALIITGETARFDDQRRAQLENPLHGLLSQTFSVHWRGPAPRLSEIVLSITARFDHSSLVRDSTGKA
jgi:hypothetical protein